METFFQDIRYGFRMLRQSPGFTAVAVITLALGIGANTAMFSVINSVLFHSLPYRDPDRVMVVWKTMSNGSPNAFSTPAFLETRQQADLLAHLGAFSSVGKNLGKDVPEHIFGGRVNYDLIPVLGVKPILGRGFSVDEDRPGAGAVVILSHALWSTRFESRKDILGQAVDLDGTPYTVVGVMPPGFHVQSTQEMFWVPLQMESANAQVAARNVHWLFAYTRLPGNISLQQEQAALDAIAARLKTQDPKGEGGFGTSLQSVGDFTNGSVKPVLLSLMGAVGFVLLIACSNVANLLLARRTTRQREISIRTALGASRMRMIRQLLTESVLLAMLGGLFGLGLAWVAVRLLRLTPSATIPSAKTITIDPLVLGFTALLCGVVGILFGISPAWEGSKTNVSETLKEGARGSSGSFGKHRAVLVVVETALASMLFIGAGLSLRSLWHAETVSPGFNPEGVLTFRLAAPAQFTGDRIPLFYQQVLERLRALPGVQAAVLARNLPMSGADPSMPIEIEGTPPPPSQIPVVTRLRAVGPNYFSGLQTPLISGREFDEHDTAAAPKVAIVSQSLAKLYWPSESAIGKRVKPAMPGGDWCVVVGVASDVHHWAADVDVEPTAYYPYTQIPAAFLPLLEGNMSFAVRSNNTAGLLDSIRGTVGEVDKTVPVYQVKNMEEMVAESGSLRRFDMWLIGGFAGLALVLAAVGIYGVMAYSVSQRTREIGIRMAMGAQQHNVLLLILGQGAKLALAGVVVGLIGAVALANVMASLVFGVSPRDIATFSVVPWLVLLLILIGCYVPARRAARVNPMVALRYE
jgi:putative ABC transport system permease protein